VHVVFCRVADDNVIEVIRVLHERMQPSRHWEAAPGDPE
jgi:plasmid stabilization system protein ParE